MEVIKNTIQSVMQRWETSRKESLKDNPEVILKKVFSKKELEHIKLNYCKKGILSINVDSSAWLYQLNLQKENLLTRFRKKYNMIKDIRFYLGETR